MGSTFFSLHHHVVFSTKDRRPYLTDTWRASLFKYIGGVIRNLGGIAETVNGVEDHVHILLSLKTTHAPADLIRELKKSSHTWAAEKYEPLFGWQDGYGIFSVSSTHIPALKRYIATQEAHHCKTSFKQEYTRLLQKNGIPFDPKYLG